MDGYLLGSGYDPANRPARDNNYLPNSADLDPFDPVDNGYAGIQVPPGQFQRRLRATQSQPNFRLKSAPLQSIPMYRGTTHPTPPMPMATHMITPVPTQDDIGYAQAFDHPHQLHQIQQHHRLIHNQHHQQHHQSHRQAQPAQNSISNYDHVDLWSEVPLHQQFYPESYGLTSQGMDFTISAPTPLQSGDEGLSTPASGYSPQLTGNQMRAPPPAFAQQTSIPQSQGRLGLAIRQLRPQKSAMNLSTASSAATSRPYKDGARMARSRTAGSMTPLEDLPPPKAPRTQPQPLTFVNMGATIRKQASMGFEKGKVGKKRSKSKLKERKSVEGLRSRAADTDPRVLKQKYSEMLDAGGAGGAGDPVAMSLSASLTTSQDSSPDTEPSGTTHSLKHPQSTSAFNTPKRRNDTLLSSPTTIPMKSTEPLDRTLTITTNHDRSQHPNHVLHSPTPAAKASSLLISQGSATSPAKGLFISGRQTHTPSISPNVETFDSSASSSTTFSQTLDFDLSSRPVSDRGRRQSIKSPISAVATPVSADFLARDIRDEIQTVGEISIHGLDVPPLIDHIGSRPDSRNHLDQLDGIGYRPDSRNHLDGLFDIPDIGVQSPDDLWDDFNAYDKYGSWNDHRVA